MVDITVLDAGDIAERGEELVRAVNAFDEQMWAESDPGEGNYTTGITRQRLTESWRSFEHRRWMATTEGGDLVGMARMDVNVEAEDDPTASVQVAVTPPNRRRGVGTALFSAAVADVRRRGRTIVSIGTSDRVPAGAAFAEHIGAEPKLVQRQSECVLREIDHDMVASWIDVPADVLANYELWRSTGPYPEEEYARIAAVQNVIQDQPYDELERRDVNFTAEHIAHSEAQRDWSVGDRWTHFIRHRSTGDLVGYTRVYIYPDWDVAEQGDTAVDPRHRGHGLGKWLKASMAHHLLTERRHVERIRTTNAFTNGPMLAINDAMGFKVTKTLTEWQARI